MEISRLNSQLARMSSGLPVPVKNRLPEVLAVPARLPAPEDRSYTGIKGNRADRFEEIATAPKTPRPEAVEGHSRALVGSPAEIFMPSRVSAPFLAQQLAQEGGSDDMDPAGASEAVSAYHRTLGLTAVVMGLQGGRERHA